MGESNFYESKIVQISAGESKAIYVEVIERELVTGAGTRGDRLLPEGAEIIGSRSLSESVAQVSELIESVAEMVSTSLAKIQPEELSTEISIGFAGKLNPVPFLVGTETNAALKVKITWKKAK